MAEEMGEVKPLDRYLSQTDVCAMAFGCMVGWGVFAMPGNTFLPVAGPLGTLIAMIIGMVIMLIIGRSFSYLMGRSSMTGGVYSYTKEAFGRDHAFLCAWFLCLSYLTIVFLNGTAIFYVIRILIGDVVKAGPHYSIAGNDIYLAEAAVSTFVLALAGILSVTAKPLLQHLFTVLSITLFAGIVATVAICLPQAVEHGALVSFGLDGSNPLHAIFSLVILAPWAFVGFEVTSFETAHFDFPITKSRSIIVLAIVGTAFAYGSMALVSVAAVPEGFSSWQDYIANLGSLSGIASVPTFYAVSSLMGGVGLAIMTVTAVAAMLTGIIGGYRATTRILSTMAEDRILSQRFSQTTYSILFIMAISIVLSLLGRNTLNWFVDLTSFGAIVGFGYTSAAAWKVANSEGNKGIARTGAVGTVLSVVFATVQLVPKLAAMETMGSEAHLMLALWCLLGFVFYWRTIQNSNLTDHSGLSTSGIVLFSLLIYSSLMWLAKLIMAQESVEAVHTTLIWGGFIVLPIVFVGLIIMLYVQNVVRKKHEASEREKIHAVESSLAKSQFLFNMSHDIRTPMNAIIGYTNLALEETSLPTVHEHLQKIDRSNKQLLNLINDILEMSRIESGKVELELAPVDLQEVMDGVRELFSEQMKQKRMDFGVHTAQIRNRYVWCDEKNLNRILLNVLSNAYKFTPEDGTVSLTVWETTGRQEGYSSYEIRVQDNGIGMSKEFAERMFSAFERERTSTASGIEGTGLGLSITKSLVDLMGGTIEVLTAPGAGTEVIIRLTFRLASENEVPRAAALSAGTAGGDSAGRDAEAADGSDDVAAGDVDDSASSLAGRRLLLVEDNAINMEIASMILEQHGFEVERAENGQEAVDMVCAADAGHYDAVLMDIQMPVMDGYEATRRIRALDDPVRASVPIMAMTANAFSEDVQAAFDAGMQAHIAKPIDVDTMLQTIAEVLAAREA